MGKGMTDNEIIKALERCKVTKAPNIGVYISAENILDLINRQKEEVERLQDIIISNDEERLSYSAITMKKEQELMHAERIRGLEAEIEKLKDKDELTKVKEVCSYQKGEIQRLNFEVSRRYTQKELNQRIIFHKNKAIKEFLDKLQTKLDIKDLHKEYPIFESDVELFMALARNLLKEMEGEENGK